jgi:hypothetical protein
VQQNFNRTGVEACQVGECTSPVPELDAACQKALELFRACQSQWMRGGMSERRLGIPRQAVAIEAAARQIVLSEFLLDKFAVCESVIVAQDLEKLNNANER